MSLELVNNISGQVMAGSPVARLRSDVMRENRCALPAVKVARQ